MPFGLLNAPSTFQQLMNRIFSDMLDICVVIYLDNILIYLDNITEHRNHIKEVLCHLWANGLYVSPNKCMFHCQEVEFLGYILGPQEVWMDKGKVQVIQD